MSLRPEPLTCGAAHGHGVSRRGRQLGELRALCGSGAVCRAIDLAYLHFADFGPDEEVVALLVGAAERTDATIDVRARLADLLRPKR